MTDKILENWEIYSLCLELHEKRLREIFKCKISRLVLKTCWFFNHNGFWRWFRVCLDSQKWTERDIYVIYQSFRATYSSVWQVQLLYFFKRLNIRKNRKEEGQVGLKGG